MISRAIRSLVLALVILAPVAAMAQTSQPPAGTSGAAPLKPAELDQLVAPIALYPDPLLAEVLMASAYPLDVVQAERWVEANKTLKGEQLKAAADKQAWDDSVKALVATPDVLAMMSKKIDWTQKLGDAVVAQQPDVMDAIQRLRTKAQANNKLQSTKEQAVTVKRVESKQIIAIEPTDPNMVYVPYYDPGVVYGDWPYPDYPPYYWPAPGYIGAGIIATGLAFGAGYALGRWAGGGNYWGGNVNWNNNNINVNRPINGGGTNWKPRVDHRQGVGNRAGQGLNFRGSGGNQVIKPGGGHGNLAGQNRPANRPAAGAGNRQPNAGARPSAGNRAAHRPSGGNRAAHRPSGGARPNAGVAHRGGGGAHVAHRGGGGGGAAMRAHGGGGGAMRGGGGGGARGGGGGGHRGGGRRSDIRLKHDIVLLDYLDNGLGFYRFSYNGSTKTYVGVMAQEVQQVMPEAVARGRDGYLMVNYDKLGLKFESYGTWIRSGAKIPYIAATQP